ncbi:sigma-70 family RNA polymerase sigma factor [Cryomorpha ignava]|uniref:Sigma-70 family RNA polymerase sigma factor n=1 Tax=Cryomorpha ignava TaxID=101383 RepID=A0A7K3WS04_9FLAO|nr:sigma-70 family RNA polymerase sigma factor [Cryomorpha ignava]NEN24459.1 sigma-70 family RNA polymerase sigma factor [Cryomorpha ignava]
MKQIKVNFKVPDHELTEGFIQNDRKCMEQIYAQNYKSVEMYILQNSGKEADAKDIYQEAIVAAWINVKEGKFELQGGKTIGGYIFQIAKFKWLDKLKSKAHKATVRLVHENQPEETADNDYNEEEDSRMQYLTELYKNLDEKCKAILNRFYYQKMSLEEIGSELDHDPGTVKTLKYRCMKKLRSFHTNNLS